MTIITQTGNDSVHINANWNGSAYSNTSGLSEGILLEKAGTNLLANPEAPVTQDVTVTADYHTLSMTGTGSVTTVAGTATADTALSFTPTAGTFTVTVVGNVDSFQLEASPFETSFMPSGSRSDTFLSCAIADLGLPDLTDNFTLWIELRFPFPRSTLGVAGEYLLRMVGGARVLNIDMPDRATAVSSKSYPVGSAITVNITTPEFSAGDILTYAYRYESGAAGITAWINGVKGATEAATVPFDTALDSLYLGHRPGTATSVLSAIVSKFKLLATAESDATIEGWG